jgi:hypothetical protein
MGGIFSAQDDGAAPSRAVLLPGAREDVEAAVQDLMQETRCPICLDFFTNPRSAPCQHNFCEVCAARHFPSPAGAFAPPTPHACAFLMYDTQAC